ncbi:MAG: hypothetical protein QOG62_2237 [Thermoleophilaceae bacterium]|jgi:hypothetical protein|nr:hypothetical protein [Thermoleophilaceae bacterium]
MNDPVALMLQLGFLAVLYLFLFWIARSAVKDLSRREVAPAGYGGVPDDRAGADLRVGSDPRLVVIAAMASTPGEEIPLGEGVMLGRSAGADIQIEDKFASNNHARLYTRAGAAYVEDLGSTNGTYLNGRRLNGSSPLAPGDSIRIGDTEFRYQD